MPYMMNELSLSKVGSTEKLQKLLEQFVKAVIEAKKIGIQELRLHEAVPDLFAMQLHDGYSIGGWLNDNRVDHDLRDRFREIVTSTPLIKKEELQEFELFSYSEFYKLIEEKSHRVWGLGAAYIYDTLSISLATHLQWGKTEVEVDHYYLDQDIGLLQEPVKVRNFSSEQNLQVHHKWWDQQQMDALKSSAELWDKRHEFFPNLELSGEVQKQLEAIGVTKALSQMVDRLKTLDRYSERWTEGDFSYKDVVATTNLEITGESSTTMQKYGSQRKFNIPGQGKKTCELHIKAGNLRFHFYPDNAAKKIYVGYIGKHLRIASE